MSDSGNGLSRRSFLWMVGAAGGAAAVRETMTAMGMMRGSEAWAGPPRLTAGSGKGKKVLILGAGVGALTAAYELTRVGYDCEMIEAQDRAGGRSFTARAGDQVIEESPEHGRTVQTCRFTDGLYLNMGPGRLPYHHRRALHYCRQLGVPLEIYVMTTTANLFQTDEAFGGQAIPRRQIANDTRGYIAEMLAKAVRGYELDLPVGEEDEARLLDLLRVFGDLDKKDRYTGSTRSGCAFPLTVHQACEPSCPLPLKQLLNAEFWEHRFYQPDDFEWQPTLFEPSGGMDQIVQHFVARLEEMWGDSSPGNGSLRLGAEVTKVLLLEDRVEVEYRDRASGRTGKASGDFCVSNIPFPVLQRIARVSNFSDDFRAALDQGRFAHTCKVGWQAEERFWESDRYGIYGGISYIDHPINQIWYPSSGYFTRKGTLTGAYNYDETAASFGALSLTERLRVARQGGIRLHEEFADRGVVPEELGLSIAWKNVPFQEGGWSDWTDSPEDTAAYARLLAPDAGRFHIVGDQVSTLPGWQEGAMMSAEHVVEQIAGLRPLTVPEIRRAPETRRLVQGRF